MATKVVGGGEVDEGGDDVGGGDVDGGVVCDGVEGCDDAAE